MLAIALLALPSQAHELEAGDGYAAARANFATAMTAITDDAAGVLVTSKQRSEADQVRLAELGYRPHPLSQHKLGLAWDVAAPIETLETLRDLARERGFTALLMESPVTGSSYLHVQRYARSPLAEEPETALASIAEPEPPVEAESAEPAPEVAIAPPRPVDGMRLDLPRRLLRKQVDGRIVLLLQVSEEGRVLDVEVDSSDLPEFEDVVASEVRRWTFHPPTREGRPVVATARLPIPIRIE